MKDLNNDWCKFCGSKDKEDCYNCIALQNTNLIANTIASLIVS